MPIYAYKCSSCGHAKDVLQKVSDAPLTQCPECGAQTFAKQLTAAGFQLKGSGWYVTDFRNGSKAGDARSGKDAQDGKTETAAETKAENKSESKTESAGQTTSGDKAGSGKSASGDGASSSPSSTPKPAATGSGSAAS